MELKDKLTIGLAGLSFVCALASVGYTFVATERGPVWGHPEPTLNYGGKIVIRNGLAGVEFIVPFEAGNSGTLSFTIKRMTAMISYAGQEHPLLLQGYKIIGGNDWFLLGGKTIAPRENWQVTLSFAKQKEIDDLEREAELFFCVAENIQTQYLKMGDAKRAYRVDDKVILAKIAKALKKESEWLKAGEYKLTVAESHAG